MKLTKDEIQTLVINDIENNEKLGSQSGGSGHLGFVFMKLTK